MPARGPEGFNSPVSGVTHQTVEKSRHFDGLTWSLLLQKLGIVEDEQVGFREVF